jgi:DNA-binding NarL/FixJ family response regulator
MTTETKEISEQEFQEELNTLMLQAAEAAVRRGDLVKAQECARAVLARFPNDDVAALFLLYYSKNLTDEHPQSSALQLPFLQRAAKAWALGKIHNAERLLRAFCNLMPDNALGHFLLYLLLFQSSRTSESLAELNAATRLNPNVYSAYHSFWRELSKDFPEARNLPDLGDQGDGGSGDGSSVGDGGAGDRGATASTQIKRLRVLLVENHVLVRAHLRQKLESNPNIESVIEISSGREALDLAKTQHPDIVLMDISISELNGLETTARLTKLYPQIRVIILSAHSSPEYIVQALRAGAVGYVLKESAPAELDMVISAVVSGGSYLSPALSAAMIDDYLQQTKEEADPLAQLTPRQREILQLVAEGKSTKEIAHLLKVSVKTIETHRAQIMNRLGIHDVLGLIQFAIRTGLVPPEVSGN